MKRLYVHIEETLLNRAKAKAKQTNISMKELLIQAIHHYLVPAPVMEGPIVEDISYYDEDGDYIRTYYVDESPPLPELTPQDFYGKIEVQEERTYDLDNELERMMYEELMRYS